METCNCCEKYKASQRDDKLSKDLKTRLNRINGQILGIQNMIDTNRYCGDILIQLSASINALKKVSYMILKNHMETCVASDLKENKFETIDEMIELIEKLK